MEIWIKKKLNHIVVSIHLLIQSSCITEALEKASSFGLSGASSSDAALHNKKKSKL